jgi:peptide/nickel transport system substrate-binding protein
VEQFRPIGINATHRNEAGATWGDNFAFGKFETRMGWQACGSVMEPWTSMETMNVRWLTPIGERSSLNNWRWSGPVAEKYGSLVDEMGALPLDDPKIDDLFVKAMELWFQDLPLIPVTQARKLIPFDTTYWTGWATVKNNYQHPCTWWQSTHQHIHKLQPAAR